jgi:uncharacterized protein (DUF1330 family)
MDGRDALAAGDGTMSIYLLAAIDIHDRAAYSLYSQQARIALAPFSVRTLTIDPEPTVYEGTQPANFMMLIEFESQDALEAFYASEAYGIARPMRHAASTTKFIMGMKPFTPNA